MQGFGDTAHQSGWAEARDCDAGGVMGTPALYFSAGVVAMLTPVYGVAIYGLCRLALARLPADEPWPARLNSILLSVMLYFAASAAAMSHGGTPERLGRFLNLEAGLLVVGGAFALTAWRARGRGELWPSLLQKNALKMAGVGLVIGLLFGFSALPDMTRLGPSVAMFFMSMLYGVMLYIIAALVGVWLRPQRSEECLDTFHTSVPLATIQLGFQLADYRLFDVIGEGGMGRVYRGRHRDPVTARSQGDVAVKLLKAGLAQDARFRARFAQEAGLGLAMTHPGLAVTHELIDTETHLGLVMEYVDGVAFDAYVRPRPGTLTGYTTILSAVASVLDYLHEKNEIHRDVKPDNIRVRDTGAPVLLDLGIAKVSSSANRLTQTGATMGTVIYMAPEQVETSEVGPAADQYALGMIVYELLAQRLPWAPDLNTVQIFTIKQRGTLLPLHETGQGSTPAVSAVVHRALAVDPAHRYPSCAEFVTALLAAHHQPPGPEDRRPVPDGEADTESFGAKKMTVSLKGRK